MVTGSSGLVGGRLVEMLFERGAKSVTAFDLKVRRTARVQDDAEGKSLKGNRKGGELRGL